jgi:hypothetical protein
MQLLDVLTGHEYDCRLITAERNKAEKSLGGGWFQFVRDNHLQEGDMLLFDLGVPPTVLFVELVRRNDIA